ncbi:MAG: tetratricopeptide repeat protein [Polyangiaceae bacterium]
MRKLREIPVQCRARRAVVVAGYLAILTSSASLQAEEPTPGALFEQGQAAFAAKRFRQAAEHFEHAYRLSPTSQAAYNAGLAWDGADERARAANTLTRAINLGGLSKDELREASRRLAQLLPTLFGKISISALMGTKVRVGELEPAYPARPTSIPGAIR